jgi:AcrR family transcriptional regulator
MPHAMSEIPTQPSSRDRLISAALSLLARQGFAHTSTAQVARQAGTSESQLIKHFGSKEGLLDALFDEAWRDLNDRVDQLSSAYPDPVGRLKAIVVLIVARLAANDEVGRLMLFEGRRIRSRGAAVSDGFVRFVDGIDALLAEAKRAGRLRLPLALPAIRSLLIGACEGMLRDRQLAKAAAYPAAYSRKDVDRAMEILIDTFFADPPFPPSRKAGIASDGRRTRKGRSTAVSG